MAKKTLGYVELEWTCPNCGTKNPGPKKTCQSCGMPQPDDVKFEKPVQEKLIEDEAKIEQAKAGADIHCYYCGTRNPATATNCSQCGADLTEGTKRESGQVLGAHSTKAAKPVECPACGTSNDPSAPKCVQCGASLAQPKAEPPPPPKPKPAPPQPKRRRSLLGGIFIGIVLFMCACVITFIVLSNQTEELNGTVRNVSWQRTVVIEELKPVTSEGWREDIPPGAVIGACTEKVHHNENRATGKTREVCGTPYTVDKGSGFGEVVQDCRTVDVMEAVPVYADSCQYTVEQWQEVDKAEASGNNFMPQWPDFRLTTKQREGERSERYRCIFSTEQGEYTYTTSTQTNFNRCEIGSRWIIEVNTFDAVTEIKPLQ